MYPIEREKEILRVVDTEGKASVERLAELTGTSEMTVRRDLEKLETRGLIVRTHGGAVKREYANESPFNKRDAERGAEKSALAARAALLVEDGSTVYLDSSTTAMRVVPFLADKDVTVITNGLMTAAECSKYSVRAICTGGALNALSYTLTGIEALKCAERYRADIFLFSCKGISPVGIYESSPEVCAVKEAMARNSRRTVLLVDSSKVGEEGKVRLDLDPDLIVTDGDVEYRTEVIYL